MAEGRDENLRTSTVTQVADTQVTGTQATSPRMVLKLRKPKPDKKVNWTETTVDNEHMNKKKSKCCCIYEKPREFDESSSESEGDDECGHCRGHKDKCFKQGPTAGPPAGSSGQNER